MATQNAHEKTVSSEKSRKKKGVIYLIAAAVLLIVSLVLYNAGIGGIISALITLAWVVLLIMGLVYLIMGFVKKD